MAASKANPLQPRRSPNRQTTPAAVSTDHESVDARDRIQLDLLIE